MGAIGSLWGELDHCGGNWIIVGGMCLVNLVMNAAAELDQLNVCVCVCDCVCV